jgi:hypothetical protein
MDDYLQYARSFNASEEVLFWIEHNLSNYLQNRALTVSEVEHIIDWMIMTDQKKLKKMSYEQAKIKAEKWNKTQQKKGNNIEELPEDVEVILDFKDGFKIVKLIGENAYKREGFLMSHCVGSYFGNGKEVYSLRDKNNMPHCTIEKDQQIKGKGNGEIHPNYIDYVVKFLESIGMEVRDSGMLNLGYINAEYLVEYMNRETQKKLYNKKYLRKNEKMFNKEGDEFSSLDLLDQIPLISETQAGLKINFELEKYLKLSIDFLLKTLKTKDYSKNASSGDYSQNVSSGKDSQNASSGDYSMIASSGRYSRNASSGDYSKNASSGDYSQNVSSGKGSVNASSGECSRNASSGHYSRNASSGHYSQNVSSGKFSVNASSGERSKNASSGDDSVNASSGNYSQNASSGNYSQNASSGEYSKNASSGDYSQNEMTGKFSVAVDAGHNGKAKGKIGCWFCLSEWKEDEKETWKPFHVEAFYIDGKKVKEDTWYTLANKQLVEVK